MRCQKRPVYLNVVNGVIAAFDEVQGMDAELAGKLASFVRTYYSYIVTVYLIANTFATWQQFLLGVLDDFFQLN